LVVVEESRWKLFRPIWDGIFFIYDFSTGILCLRHIYSVNSLIYDKRIGVVFYYLHFLGSRRDRILVELAMVKLFRPIRDGIFFIYDFSTGILCLRHIYSVNSLIWDKRIGVVFYYLHFLGSRRDRILVELAMVKLFRPVRDGISFIYDFSTGILCLRHIYFFAYSTAEKRYLVSY